MEKMTEIEIVQDSTKIICPHCKKEVIKQFKVPVYTRKAIERYQEKNREVILEKVRIHSKNKYENNEEYREYKKRKAKERRDRIKLEKEMLNPIN